MNNRPAMDADDPRWLLSAVADGEADAAEVGRACAVWASGDASARQSWFAYHLVGDVLRSEDLAGAPLRDRVFLERLSARLDDEPAVLAPQPLPTPAKRWPGWAKPAAMAASLMALATVLVVALGPVGGGASAPTLAAAPVAPLAPAGDAAPVVSVSTQVAEAVAPGGRVVRDAQLDRYLRAHRDYATALPGSLPGGAGRSIATVSLER